MSERHECSLREVGGRRGWIKEQLHLVPQFYSGQHPTHWVGGCLSFMWHVNCRTTIYNIKEFSSPMPHYNVAPQYFIVSSRIKTARWMSQHSNHLLRLEHTFNPASMSVRIFFMALTAYILLTPGGAGEGRFGPIPLVFFKLLKLTPPPENSGLFLDSSCTDFEKKVKRFCPTPLLKPFLKKC